MKDYDDLFKHFKNPEESYRKHRGEIQSFLKDTKHAVLAITSMQGSGKTTAFVDEFAKSKDAMMLSQSNSKLVELNRIVAGRKPDLEYRVIYGLEQICTTYLNSDKNLKNYVDGLRKIGVLTEDIHKIICSDDECGFLTQDKSLEGRIIQTVSRFEAGITFGKQYHELHYNRMILVDEADGLMSQKSVHLFKVPFQNERINLPEEIEPFLPEIYQINAPEGTLTELIKQYEELLQDIDGNRDEIKNTIELIRLVTEGFFAVEKVKKKHGGTVRRISELPPAFFIFLKVLERRMKLVVGSATWKNNRILFKRMSGYFALAYDILLRRNLERYENERYSEVEVTEEQHRKTLEFNAYLDGLIPEVEEFKADYIPGFQTVFALLSDKHSYSNSHYRRAFDGNTEELRKRVWNELRSEIIQAIRFFEYQSGKKANRILVITFRTVKDEIERYRAKLKKNRHGNRDTLFMKMDIKPLFSNSMHGINANADGYDLILTVGDPLDNQTAKFATDMEVIELEKRGFRLKDDTDPALKKQILTTMISELLEAFHRGRGEIPIVSLSNFLTPFNKQDLRIVKEILDENNFTMVNVFLKLWNLEHKNRTPEADVFLTSLKEEIGLQFK